MAKCRTESSFKFYPRPPSCWLWLILKPLYLRTCWLRLNSSPPTSKPASAVSSSDIFRDSAHNLPFCQQSPKSHKPFLWRRRLLTIAMTPSSFHQSVSRVKDLIRAVGGEPENALHSSKSLRMQQASKSNENKTIPHLYRSRGWAAKICSGFGVLSDYYYRNFKATLSKNTFFKFIGSFLYEWSYLWIVCIILYMNLSNLNVSLQELHN